MPLSFQVTRRAHTLAMIIHTAELAAAQGDEAEAARRLQKAATLAARGPHLPTLTPRRP